MKELSLNILDITQNSITAAAKHIVIRLDETDDTLTVTIEDDGCGMSAETAARVTDPFYTTRKTRKVGLGIPFFKLAAEQTGGSLSLKSVPASENADSHGTVISATFNKKSIDYTPLGDIVSTLCILIHACADLSTDISFIHTMPGNRVAVNTAELRAVLGDTPLSAPEIMVWIRQYLEEQYSDSAHE